MTKLQYFLIILVVMIGFISIFSMDSNIYVNTVVDVKIRIGIVVFSCGAAILGIVFAPMYLDYYRFKKKQ